MRTTRSSRFGPRGLRGVALGLVLVLSATACASDADDATADDKRPEDDTTELVAQVASYELVADRDQRFIVGMFSDDDGVVSCGTAQLAFDYLGTESDPLEQRNLVREQPLVYRELLALILQHVGRVEAQNPAVIRGRSRHGVDDHPCARM